MRAMIESVLMQRYGNWELCLADGSTPGHEFVERVCMEYAQKVYQTLKNQKVRIELDDRNEKIGYKIRYARQVDRVPYMLILGEKEVQEGTISVRDRATDETTTMTMDEFIQKISAEIKDRV